MSNPTKHHDNTQVRRLKWGYEYFSISFHEPELPHRPGMVSLSCYCVPGRISSYHFDQVPGSAGVMERVRFCSEGHVNLPKALKMLHVDLEKPRVVELIKRAVGKEELIPYSRIFLELLAQIAPRSKSYRAATRVLTKLIATRRERLREGQSKTLLQHAGLLPKEKPCKSCSS